MNYHYFLLFSLKFKNIIYYFFILFNILVISNISKHSVNCSNRMFTQIIFFSGRAKCKKKQYFTLHGSFFLVIVKYCQEIHCSWGNFFSKLLETVSLLIIIISSFRFISINHNKIKSIKIKTNSNLNLKQLILIN
jgi:hypothetical protein